jgi:signal transduction histidine kinase
VRRVHRPGPDQYNPPLTWRSHLWRMAAVLLFSGTLWFSAAVPQWEQARTLFWVDLTFGLAAVGLVFLRRRWPFAIAALTNALGTVSVTANGPAALASVSLATRRVTWQILVIGVMDLVPSLSIPMLAPNRADDPLWIDFILGALTAVAMLMGGMYIGSRRELLWTLRDRARRAEAEQALRVEQGQLNERARIAREMHDVLAHRISLIAMHAGALTYRTDLTPEQVRATAGLLQTKAHEALTDLRQVLGVLRDNEARPVSQQPQPTFADLSALVLEAEDVGMRIQYDDLVVDSAQMPDQVGRTAYRIVQEALTNVRKHAPGVTALVQVSGSPADGVSIRISNPARSLAPASGSTLPPSGLGLVGLTERAMLAGGRLTTRREAGAFELEGWLPWTS